MPRGSSDLPRPPTETPAGLREMAARARRLARNILDGQTIKGLTELAEELETRAAAMEAAPQTVSHDEAAALQQSDPDLGQS
jgi:hypothetical protein